MTPDRRTLLALFALAFGLRVLYAVTLGADPDLGLLTETYDYRVAERIHGSLAWIGEPFSPDAPGYIAAVAAVMTILPDSVWSVMIFQAFLCGITGLFLYRIGEQRLGKGVGLLSAVWLALYVHHIHFSSILLRDTLVVFLWVWFVRILVKRAYSVEPSIKAAVVFAALLYVEPMFLPLLPLVILLLFLYATDRRYLNLQSAILFFVTVLVLLVPWTIRNYVVYREPIPIALEATRYTRPFFGREETAVEPEAGMEGKRVKVSPGILHNAKEFWRVTRFAESPGYPDRGIPAEPAWSTRHNAISLVSYGLLLPFAIFGVFIGFRGRQRAPIAIFVAIAAYFLLRILVATTDERSRLPVEPLLILLAFHGVMQIAARLRPAAQAGDAPEAQSGS